MKIINELQPLPLSKVEIIERALVGMALTGNAKKHTITLHLCINHDKGIYEDKEFTFYKLVKDEDN
jgi:hypothetical protein